jgi:hypothetical protein
MYLSVSTATQDSAANPAQRECNGRECAVDKFLRPEVMGSEVWEAFPENQCEEGDLHSQDQKEV